MTMAAASAFGAADFRRRAAGIPRIFRETGFDRKTILCCALDSVSRIERHQSHAICFSYLVRRVWSQSFNSHAALTGQELLSNIEQSQKELFPGSQAGARGNRTDPSRGH
jgi:hypothetical protein